ncbi:MAG: hypothetical protein JXN62_09475 [Bacteroidales bacterium]|nr:hypothetical protein [Bacteroidales bacterium]
MGNIHSFKDWVSLIADIATIIALIGLSTFGYIRKNKDLIAFKINEFIKFIIKLTITLVIGYLFFILIFFINTKLLSSWNLLGKITIISILVIILLTILWLTSTIFWTMSLKYVRNFWNFKAFKELSKELKRDTELVIEEAIYKANDVKYFNVTEKLKEMILKNTLKVTSSNFLAGDPLYGVPKSLIISYRFGKNSEIQTIVVKENETVVIKYDKSTRSGSAALI